MTLTLSQHILSFTVVTALRSHVFTTGPSHLDKTWCDISRECHGFFPANSDKANSIQRFLPSYTVLSFQENSWSWIIFLDAPQKILRIWAKLWTYTTWIESVLPAGEAQLHPFRIRWTIPEATGWWSSEWDEDRSILKHRVYVFFEDEGVVAEDVSRRVQYCQCSHQHGRWVCEEFYDFKRYFGKVTNLGSL